MLEKKVNRSERLECMAAGRIVRKVTAGLRRLRGSNEEIERAAQEFLGNEKAFIAEAMCFGQETATRYTDQLATDVAQSLRTFGDLDVVLEELERCGVEDLRIAAREEERRILMQAETILGVRLK